MAIKNEVSDKILAAAEKLFAEHGFEGTSTRALAAAAGVNLAMISYYFGSKEELFKQLLVRRIQVFREKLTVIAYEEAPAWQKMQTIINAYVYQILVHTDLHQIMYRELSLENSPVRAAITEHILGNMQNMHHVVEQGQAEGIFRADVDKHLLMATLTGTIVQTIKSPFLTMQLLGGKRESGILFNTVEKEGIKAYLIDIIGRYLLV